MMRALAIVERELRKFIRTPVLLTMTLVMPILNLLVLGSAFGGQVRHLNVAVVDEDGGPAARRVMDAIYTLQANGDVVRPVMFANEVEAARGVRDGSVQGAMILPSDFSRRVYAGDEPRVGLLLDNTDGVVSGAIRGLLTGAVQEARRPAPTPRVGRAVTLDAVELYPFMPYMRYMLPGVVTLAMFMTVMIGGGMSYLDDKQRGVHEGYLVTPITKFELLLGQNLAGVVKSVAAGVLVALMGALIAGVLQAFTPLRLLALVMLIICVSFAFMTMMSCIMARMDNPMVPRAMFGVLNTLLYFPSGAIYPVQSLPGWLRWISVINPFTYGVHGLRAVLLKGATLPVVLPDIGFLILFSMLMFTGAVTLFRRTL
ncbi:MAG: ABC transporter permease [Gemmatimonadota bacterium]|jgi:ABC-2 type transport system permease protein|nr:ABC transporter permease [Gemmatimonadota bacterium]